MLTFWVAVVAIGQMGKRMADRSRPVSGRIGGEPTYCREPFFSLRATAIEESGH